MILILVIEKLNKQFEPSATVKIVWDSESYARLPSFELELLNNLQWEYAVKVLHRTVIEKLNRDEFEKPGACIYFGV